MCIYYPGAYAGVSGTNSGCAVTLGHKYTYIQRTGTSGTSRYTQKRSKGVRNVIEFHIFPYSAEERLRALSAYRIRDETYFLLLTESQDVCIDSGGASAAAERRQTAPVTLSPGSLLPMCLTGFADLPHAAATPTGLGQPERRAVPIAHRSVTGFPVSPPHLRGVWHRARCASAPDLPTMPHGHSSWEAGA